MAALHANKALIKWFAQNNLPALPAFLATDNASPRPLPADLQWTLLITEREVCAMCDGMVIFFKTECLHILFMPYFKSF